MLTNDLIADSKILISDLLINTLLHIFLMNTHTFDDIYHIYIFRHY